MSEDINVGAISEALNNKADRDLVNSIPPYVVSRTPNSQGGVVEIWSDGYCVQWGITNYPQLSADGVQDVGIVLPQKLVTTKPNYVNTQLAQDGGNSWSIKVVQTYWTVSNDYLTALNVRFASRDAISTANGRFFWEVRGYIR